MWSTIFVLCKLFIFYIICYCCFSSIFFIQGPVVLKSLIISMSSPFNKNKKNIYILKIGYLYLKQYHKPFNNCCFEDKVMLSTKNLNYYSKYLSKKNYFFVTLKIKNKNKYYLKVFLKFLVSTIYLWCLIMKNARLLQLLYFFRTMNFIFYIFMSSNLYLTIFFKLL